MTIHPQAALLERLIGRFRNQSLPASLLLAGPRGVGKWSLALSLAKRISCLLATATEPCGRCDACRQFEQFAHPDVQMLFPLPASEKEWDEWYAPYLFGKQANPFAASSADPKQFIPIEAIRRFQARLATKPVLSPNKIGIVYEAERMLPGTMDSLLKLVEEPPERCFLIVVTDQPRLLLPTLLSRLQRVSVGRLADTQVIDYLKSDLGIAADRSELLARLARGSLYSIDVLVEGEFFRLRETAWEMLAAALTQSSPAVYARFSESAALSSRDRVELLCAHWQTMVRDLAILGCRELDVSDAAANLIYFDFNSNYESLAKRTLLGSGWYEINDCIERIRLELRRNVNARIAALDFLMTLQRIACAA